MAELLDERGQNSTPRLKTIIFACRSQYYVGPLDEYSFSGVEAEVHERWFGRSEKPVPTAGQVQIGDRTGLYFMPPVATNPVRMLT